MNSHPAILILESDRERIDCLIEAIAARLPGVSPVIATNPARALVLAHAREFEIIVAGPLTDAAAPFELLRSLRSEGVRGDVILLTDRILRRSSKVLHDIDVAAVVRLESGFAQRVVRHILKLSKAKQPIRRLTLKGPSQQQVDLIKITAGTLYHEISNPLMTILGMTELILDNGDPPDPEVARKVEAIRESAGRIQSTLNRLINIDEPALRDTASGQMIDPDRSRLNHKVLP